MPDIDKNVINLVLVVVTIIGANMGFTALMTNSLHARLDRIENQMGQINTQMYDLNGRLARVETAVIGYDSPISPDAPAGKQPPASQGNSPETNPTGSP